MRSLVALVVVTILSGCTPFALEDAPVQLLETKSVHTFVSSIGPFGQRVAAANAVYRPRFPGLNPYFGR